MSRSASRAAATRSTRSSSISSRPNRSAIGSRKSKGGHTKMASFKLNRRVFLTGLGGVAVGLPLLEIMLDRSPSSQAAEIPKRFLVCFDGQSLGADDDQLHNDYVPDTIGPSYDLKSALAPIADFGVQSDIS